MLSVKPLTSGFHGGPDAPQTAPAPWLEATSPVVALIGCDSQPARFDDQRAVSQASRIANLVQQAAKRNKGPFSKLTEYGAGSGSDNMLPAQPVDATLASILSAGVSTPPVRGQLVTRTDDEGPPNARPIDFSAPAGFQRSHN